MVEQPVSEDRTFSLESHLGKSDEGKNDLLGKSEQKKAVQDPIQEHGDISQNADAIVELQKILKNVDKTSEKSVPESVSPEKEINTSHSPRKKNIIWVMNDAIVQIGRKIAKLLGF